MWGGILLMALPDPKIKKAAFELIYINCIS